MGAPCATCLLLKIRVLGRLLGIVDTKRICARIMGQRATEKLIVIGVLAFRYNYRASLVVVDHLQYSLADELCGINLDN